jgi:hypothetical protein
MFIEQANRIVRTTAFSTINQISFKKYCFIIILHLVKFYTTFIDQFSSISPLIFVDYCLQGTFILKNKRHSYA